MIRRAEETAAEPGPEEASPAPPAEAVGPSVAPPSAARGVGSTVRGVVRTMRIRQWAKNVLVFAAPAAAGVLTHATPFLRTLAAFGLFCAAASGTYFLNDAMDAEADRHHPVKRHRPVAAGILSVPAAATIGVVLMAAAIGLGALLRPQLGVVLAVYVVLQIAYSTYLKHLPVYDLACVAAGFLLRAVAGGVAVPVPISEWFLIVTTFGSLLMVTGKRLAEHAELGEDRGRHRATLDAYTTTYLRIIVALSATGAVVGYSLWAFGLRSATLHHHDGIWYELSIIPVLLALMHYTFLIDHGKGARPEELVLRDRQLQVLGVAWAVLFALGVYG